MSEHKPIAVPDLVRAKDPYFAALMDAFNTLAANANRLVDVVTALRAENADLRAQLAANDLIRRHQRG